MLPLLPKRVANLTQVDAEPLLLRTRILLRNQSRKKAHAKSVGHRFSLHRRRHLQLLHKQCPSREGPINTAAKWKKMLEDCTSPLLAKH